MTKENQIVLGTAKGVHIDITVTHIGTRQDGTIYGQCIMYTIAYALEYIHENTWKIVG